MSLYSHRVMGRTMMGRLGGLMGPACARSRTGSPATAAAVPGSVCLCLEFMDLSQVGGKMPLRHSTQNTPAGDGIGSRPVRTILCHPPARRRVLETVPLPVGMDGPRERHRAEARHLRLHRERTALVEAVLLVEHPE